MSRIENPALRQYLAELREEALLAQVLVRRTAGGYELRHRMNRDAVPNDLRLVTVAQIRPLAQFTATGEFRPLKCAPTLAAGWRLMVSTDDDLEFALNQLYPGAIADRFAARAAHPPVTHYRDFTARQSGMYRITTMLSDAQAAGVTETVCNPANCEKRRLWTVPGLAADNASKKSVIPCLEPCAVLLESARKAVRLEQEKVRESQPAIAA